MLENKLEVLYEDNQILVVYKPRGILAQADSSDKADILNMAKEYIKVKYQKPGNVYLGLVHRLDINTAGIMVLARTSKSASRLSESIQTSGFNKEYLAIVEGDVKSGKLVNNLVKIDKKAYVKKEGKEAILSYNKLYNIKIDKTLCSVVKIRLETGRFHQIRCQFSYMGNPLYGDKKYGSFNQTDNVVLQAYKLTITHPVTKEELTFKRVDNTNYFKGIDDYDI